MYQRLGVGVLVLAWVLAVPCDAQAGSDEGKGKQAGVEKQAARQAGKAERAAAKAARPEGDAAGAEMRERRDKRKAIQEDYRRDRQPGQEGRSDDASREEKPEKKPWWKFWG